MIEVENGKVRPEGGICEHVQIYHQLGGIYGPRSDILMLSEIMDE
jgi:hypothetical protein